MCFDYVGEVGRANLACVGRQKVIGGQPPPWGTNFQGGMSRPHGQIKKEVSASERKKTKTDGLSGVVR